MISTGLEIAGFASAIAGAAVTWGLGVALFVAAPCLLFMGFAAEGVKVKLPKIKRKA